jgi:DNA-binding response OmpR family regulator
MGPRSILICDDEVELAEELCEFLSGDGWRVRVATTGHDAEAILRGGIRPECLLTDLRILDYDGTRLVALARSLPAERQPAVIGVMTGHLDDGVTAAEIGADAIFFKPIDGDVLSSELLARVERADIR